MTLREFVERGTYGTKAERERFATEMRWKVRACPACVALEAHGSTDDRDVDENIWIGALVFLQLQESL